MVCTARRGFYIGFYIGLQDATRRTKLVNSSSCAAAKNLHRYNIHGIGMLVLSTSANLRKTAYGVGITCFVGDRENTNRHVRACVRYVMITTCTPKTCLPKSKPCIRRIAERVRLNTLL